jgi:hypothetical protein
MTSFRVVASTAGSIEGRPTKLQCGPLRRAAWNFAGTVFVLFFYAVRGANLLPKYRKGPHRYRINCGELLRFSQISLGAEAPGTKSVAPRPEIFRMPPYLAKVHQMWATRCYLARSSLLQTWEVA